MVFFISNAHFDRDGSDEGKLNKKWFSMPDLDEKKKRAMEREEEEARDGLALKIRWSFLNHIASEG